MKINKMLACFWMMTASFSAYALATFQAGSIENGGTWTISDSSGVASYYADGSEGSVLFVCTLRGEPDRNCKNDQLTARLSPGKNFSHLQNPLATTLHAGFNGPFTWVLTNEGENNGNIKVFYKCGKDVTIQCQQSRDR
jgi:hypothetical protein